MKLYEKILVLVVAMGLFINVAACAGSDRVNRNGQEAEKILYTAANFAYPSLDAHKEYYGWYTSIYGITETLFKLADDLSAEPWLAETASVEGNAWTIVLNENACFSNGNPVTADMVVRNLERVASVNSRFNYMQSFLYEVIDERTFTISSEQIYPTMMGTLASPELAVLDLDHISDFDHEIIGTGPFILDTFEAEGTVTVRANGAYWDGQVLLDGAVFYYMQDDDAKLLAMQNGEIDCYNSVTSAAMEIYQADPVSYTLVSIPATRLQFYILNQNRLSGSVLEAVSLAIDNESMAAFLGGTVTPADGPFNQAAAYGKVQGKSVDTEMARQLLEDDGYMMGNDGYYTKDGQILTINVAYYAARSLDTLAVLMQEQLQAIGIKAELTSAEDPDATYIASADFDIALYCMISDTSGDPEYFITSTLADDSYFNVGGFENAYCESLIQALIYETDQQKRAELANEIVQISVDENALGYIGLFNKVTVLGKGVSGFAENSPFDFYGLQADTDKRIGE